MAVTQLFTEKAAELVGVPELLLILVSRVLQAQFAEIGVQKLAELAEKVRKRFEQSSRVFG